MRIPYLTYSYFFYFWTIEIYIKESYLFLISVAFWAQDPAPRKSWSENNFLEMLDPDMSVNTTFTFEICYVIQKAYASNPRISLN